MEHTQQDYCDYHPVCKKRLDDCEDKVRQLEGRQAENESQSVSTRNATWFIGIIAPILIGLAMFNWHYMSKMSDKLEGISKELIQVSTTVQISQKQETRTTAILEEIKSLRQEQIQLIKHMNNMRTQP